MKPEISFNIRKCLPEVPSKGPGPELLGGTTSIGPRPSDPIQALQVLRFKHNLIHKEALFWPGFNA